MGASPGSSWPAARRASIAAPTTTCAVRVVGSAGLAASPRGLRLDLRPARTARSSSMSAAAAPTCARASCRATRCCRYGRGDLRPLPAASTCTPSTRHGREVVGELGELGDHARRCRRCRWRSGATRTARRLRAAYFDRWPGVWRHGDWIVFNERGSCTCAGRSDATLNRGGVRLGTAEFYAVVEELDGIADSLVVHLEDPRAAPASCAVRRCSRGARLDERAARGPRRRAAQRRCRPGTSRTRSPPCRRSRAT